MKNLKMSILVFVLLSYSGVLQAQNNPDSGKVVVLYDYLYVYPEDLGEFSSEPVNLIEQINRQKKYGYDDWRMPTREELEIIRGKMSKVLKPIYMSSKGPLREKGKVHFVNFWFSMKSGQYLPPMGFTCKMATVRLVRIGK